MTPLELGEVANAFLSVVLTQADELKAEDEGKTYFILAHSKNVYEIGSDILLLFTNHRSAASSVAIRTMIESTFCVAAACKVKSFPVEKVIAEFESLADRAERNWTINPGSPVEDAVKTFREAARSLRQKHSVTSKNKWSIADIAKAGDLQEFYNSTYFIHCNYVHPSAGGMAVQRKNVAAPNSLQTAIACMLFCTALIVDALKTRNPKEHVETLNKLQGILVSLSEAKEFRKKIEAT